MATDNPVPADCPVFYHGFNTSSPLTTSQLNLQEILKDNIKDTLAGLENDTPPKFRWFHLPVNNMALAEKFLSKVGPSNFKLDEKTWNLKLRPALSSAINLPLHSIHMEPSCDTQDPQESRPQSPLATLYVPYMNYDIYSNYQLLQRLYAGDLTAEEAGYERMIMERESTQDLNATHPLHPRRTLDQFFYPSLIDTTARDSDQTLSKWTGSNLGQEGRHKAADDSLLILVDQLWCWVVDKDTIVTFFPSHNTQYGDRQFHDLYRSINNAISNCDTIWDLYALLFKEASTYLFSLENRKHMDILGIYRWVASHKAADQTIYLQGFQRAQSAQAARAASLDYGPELKLFLEVADIIDEIKMIKHLVKQQRAVLKELILALRRWVPVDDNQFHRGSVVDISVPWSSSGFESLVENTKLLASRVAGAAKTHIIDTEEMLVSLLANFNAVQEDAEYTQKILLGLLDLKQKTASLGEARSTTKQGGAIMLFTIVTVLFLPLSFFTSFFGQNVSEITGDRKNPTTWELWRIATRIVRYGSGSADVVITT
ncbi:hypothetical protein F4821DRAFT_265698 [Hypoxylon rubiginosum]|uniref:Uncharacterized protein n=1 Tax=Hypoxylon rubiginosum TaxID=110542 RepID=A0ACC0CJZ1_9PEZI|nr:hypothetical protein F4821DRAFT_265698 [Hypoxylon rubiginosum]